MREIKFRGFGAGKWRYGYYVHFDERPLSVIYNTKFRDFIISQGKYGEHTIPVDPETVGQFTGLHDKNGKEIYEGDIVKLYFPLSDEKDADLHEVRWNDKLGRYELVFICPFNGKENYLLFCDIANMTVVGNIYDNKELLTQTIKQ